jgi:predicted RNA-binding Zn ribbon-like protein
LLSPDDLADWLLISPLKLAGVQVTSIEFQSGLILREAIWSSINLIRLNQNPVPADIKIINQAAAPPDLSPVFDVDHFNWTWLPPITATAALSTISRDAIDLFSGRSRTRIRKCENPKCGLFFVDQSHPGHRRWCLMERCGNMEKTTRYRHQHTTSQQDES